MTRTVSRFTNAVPVGAQQSDELRAAFLRKPVLFYLERSQNTNCVVYEANVDPHTGRLVATDPLKVYWIMYTQAPHVHEEGLTVVERHTAYGYTVVPNPARGAGWHTVTLTAVPTKPIHIAHENGVVRVVADHGGTTKELLKVYVETVTSWGLPRVKQIRLTYSKPSSTDVDTEELCPT